jgi:hypothetical protein
MDRAGSGRAVRLCVDALELLPIGQLDMHGMKSLLSVLDVKTDRIYHRVSAGKCIGDWPLAVNVGLLPFIRTEDGVAPGEAQEMPRESAAIRRAEAMARDATNAGTLAFKRSGDPGMGSFSGAVVLKTFGEVPDRLDELWRSFREKS